MNKNYIFNKINAIPKEIRTLLSAALVMLFAFVAMAKSYFNTWSDSNIVDSTTIALLSGLLLLVIIPTIKHLSHLVSIRKAVLLTMIMAACLGESRAQTPGCVNGLDFWLDPSKNVTKTGTIVTGWNDADGAGNNPALTQPTATLQPSYSAGDALSNYNPYINFVGNKRLNAAVTGANYSSNMTTFGVVNKYAAKNGYNHFIRFSSANNSDAGTHNWGFGTSNLDEDKIALHYISAPFVASSPGNGYTRLNANKLFALNTPTIMSASVNSVTGATSIGNNGNEASATGRSGGDFVPNDYLTVGGGSSFGMDNNKTQELLFYSKELTIQERQKVQTYLAIKYGITLDAQDNSAAIVEGDYILGNGTTKAWDKTANAAYHNNVFGIVKDDCQGLNQKISRSINTASMLVIGTNNMSLPLSNLDPSRTSLNNGQSFMVGDNNAASSAYTTFAASCSNPTSVILTRKWKVQNVGSVGNLFFTVNLVPSGINGDIKMVIYNTAGVAREVEGSMNADGTATFAATVANGETFTFSGVRNAGVCTTCTGAGSILWKTSGWVRGANGTTSLAITGTDASAAIEFKDPNAVEYAPAVRPKRRGKTIMLDRKDQLAVASSSYTASFTLTKAGKANFVIHAVDAWAKCLDVVEVKGYCGGTVVTPTLSYTLAANRSTYTINGNIATGILRKWSGYDYKRGKVNVSFDRQVDKIEVIWKTDKPTTRKKFQRIGISDMNFECGAPDPCLQNSEQITFEKKVVGASNIPTCEEVRFMYRIKNQNCAAKTVDISDVLPAGMTWVDDSFEDGALTSGTANAYANTGSFNLNGLSLAAGQTVIFYASAKFTNSTPAAYSNRASMAVSGGGTVQSSCGNTTWNSVAPALTPVAVPTVTLAASKTCYAPNETLTYTVTVNNTSGAAVLGMEFSTSVDEDFTYVAGSVSNLFGGTANAYGGEELLEIEGMTFPVGTSTFTYQVATGASSAAFPIFASLSADPDADCAVENARMSNEVSMTYCGVLDTDTDGIADNIDIDDDNDGVLDNVECFGSAASITNTPSWVLQGNATGVGTDITLTPNLASQSGTVWYPNQIDVTKPFNYKFQANLGTNDGGADGITFIISAGSNLKL